LQEQYDGNVPITVQRYEFILINSKLARKYCRFWLEEDFHAVELEDTALAGLSNLIGVEKLELASAFIVVVLDADASTPLLDLAFRGP
jgi:uridine phosphorylase